MKTKEKGKTVTGSEQVIGPSGKFEWALASQQLAVRVLELLNREIVTEAAIKTILAMVKEFTGLEAVAIRLKEGEDYPYYVSYGFPGEFIKAESYLCGRNFGGEIIRDESGAPVLECMCGNIISGRTDASLPFFTEGGSFWTNSTTELLAGTTEEDRQARTRNRCHGEGYESVALVPLRCDGETIGLLQLNDSRRGCFAPDMIPFLEGIGASIGIVLSKTAAEQALRASEERYRTVADFTHDWEYWTGESGRLLYISPSCERITGYSAQEFLENPDLVTRIIHPDDLAAVEQHDRDRTDTATRSLDYRILHRNGEVRWIGHVCQPVYTQDGKPLGWRASNRDITHRKRAEEERERLVIELKQALAEVKKLSGLLPICASCKKIRDDKGYWQQIEAYIRDHSEAEFSHSICPECTARLYPDFKPFEED